MANPTCQPPTQHGHMHAIVLHNNRINRCLSKMAFPPLLVHIRYSLMIHPKVLLLHQLWARQAAFLLGASQHVKQIQAARMFG